jgi:hypothetical protein
MAISYPLALPTVTRVRSIDLTAINAVAYSQSPFTFSGQAHAYQGQMWQADVSLPSMRRTAAEQWIAFLLSLRGQYGTFLLGDPTCSSIRGTATSCSITGASGANTVSATVPSGETLLAGDYIQLGSAGTATLHKVLVDYTGTGAAADLEIWPAIRTTHTASSAILSNAKGNFRLSSNQQNWSINEAAIYGITFGAMEAI